MRSYGNVGASPNIGPESFLLSVISHASRLHFATVVCFLERMEAKCGLFQLNWNRTNDFAKQV